MFFCLIVSHRLSELPVKQKQFVTKELLEQLFNILCRYLFSDKDSFYDCADEESVFRSGEWGRVLGYSVWLAYHADISLRPRLPVSATQEDKNTLRWSNACWLYLAQRLACDALAMETAGQLFAATDSEEKKIWYETLKNFSADSKKRSSLLSIDGFDLAISPKGAFDGVRLVLEQGKFCTLASIIAPGEKHRFGSDYLNLLESANEDLYLSNVSYTQKAR